jgi:hypothetical protein
MAKHRYLYHLRRFKRAMDGSKKQYLENSLIHPGHVVYQLDGRTPYFQLQGLARIDSKISKHPELGEQWLEDFKDIEDALGKYDYWLVALESNRKWKFGKDADRYMRDQMLIQLGVLESALVRHGWLLKTPTSFEFTDKPISDFEALSEEAKWYKPAKEKQKLLKFFRDEAMEIDEKLRSGEIDLNLVEEGIHEFRRKLRWLGIYSSALNGKVAIDKLKTFNGLAKYEKPEYASSKFNQLPKNSSESELIYFLPGGFFAMSELIRAIGDIKDPALATEEMERIGKIFGIKSAEVKRKLGADYLSHKDSVAKAKQIIESMVIKDEFLRHVANHFDKQLK